MTLTAKQQTQVRAAAALMKPVLRASFAAQNVGVVPGVTRDAKQARASTPAVKPAQPRAKAKAGPSNVLSLSAFDTSAFPRNQSEARSKLCTGGQAHQFGTSYGTLVRVVGDAAPDSGDFSSASGPLPAGALTLSEPYPPTLIFMPTNGPIMYRFYSPVVLERDSAGTLTYELYGLAYEDFGSTALGTAEDYQVTLKARAAPSETEANGKIVDCSTARHSFRLRNVSPDIAAGGTVRLLRQPVGTRCPVLLAGFGVQFGPQNGYYRKVGAINLCTRNGQFCNGGDVALEAYSRMLENLSNSSHMVACNGKSFVEPMQGNCVVVDPIKAAVFRKEGEISAESRSLLNTLYGSALPANVRVSSTPDLRITPLALRTGLLTGAPPAPVYDLTWTQALLRTNMLSGASFPLGSWPNFGNVGYTVDPLTLIGLEMRFPAAVGSPVYQVAHVAPEVADNAGLIDFVFPGSGPPAPSAEGFSAVGAGWDKVDVSALLSTNPTLLAGLRFVDNVSGTTYFIRVAGKESVDAFIDGPLVQSSPAILLPDDIDLDPFTADLEQPTQTPFFAVLEAVPGYSATGFPYINTYEVTARSQQFAHFTPGSLLANDQKHQPADPAGLTKARNIEEAKGSWLSKVWQGVSGAGRWAMQHRREIGAVASSFI